MKLHLIDALSAPGDPAKTNDDAYCSTQTLAAVLDGATSLGEPLLAGDSDAAWLARHGAERIMFHAKTPEAREMLRDAARDLQDRVIKERRRAPEQPYETPMASLMLLKVRSARELEAVWLGDCYAFILRLGETLERLGDSDDRRSGESQNAAKLAASMGVKPAGQLGRPEFLAALRASRNTHNTCSGLWVFAPDPACADHASSAMVAVSAGTLLLLATDGFAALSTDYGRYDAEALVRSAETSGPKPLLAELRSIEAGDAFGEDFPRFKKSDDATALLLRVED